METGLCAPTLGLRSSRCSVLPAVSQHASCQGMPEGESRQGCCQGGVPASLWRRLRGGAAQARGQVARALHAEGAALHPPVDARRALRAAPPAAPAPDTKPPLAVTLTASLPCRRQGRLACHERRRECTAPARRTQAAPSTSRPARRGAADGAGAGARRLLHLRAQHQALDPHPHHHAGVPRDLLHIWRHLVGRVPVRPPFPSRQLRRHACMARRPACTGCAVRSSVRSPYKLGPTVRVWQGPAAGVTDRTCSMHGKPVCAHVLT